LVSLSFPWFHLLKKIGDLLLFPGLILWGKKVYVGKEDWLGRSFPLVAFQLLSPSGMWLGLLRLLGGVAPSPKKGRFWGLKLYSIGFPTHFRRLNSFRRGGKI